MTPWSCSVAQVQRVQRVQRVVVAASPQFLAALRQPARFARKTIQPRLRRDGNAPLLSPAATSLHGKASHEIFSRLTAPYKFRSLATPEGEILAALIFEFLMRTKDEWQEDFPLRGKWCVSTKRGAFPRAKPGCMVFPAAKGGFKNSPLNQPALWAEPIGQCGST